ncbi:uncharacterized protein K460DRAFT_413745 [Cucurbitaria berberidis CBS 394.84]|uniref:DUF7730 domain-containing protein n=1 Tax=Cucurbitaria berberidis CBS 394.84 TaxID=1168544 RepID=A0A9P4LA07_9PLEO|nr:uncharacterized protein K460DRAFT_413745 [Cucurbitaria berberidis CBS 394.84]KAF1846923.1 hypothetical protein K460DRAFT_413745 [Cucurbitaria berberidis CBS 394.84]
MSDMAVDQETFASGRYSKRKRTQVTYSLAELDVSDSESDYDAPQSKKHKAQINSRPLPKRKIFPFMQLPAEIRNMIYSYALTDPSGINFVATTKHKRRTVERVSEETQSGLSRGWYRRGRINDQVRAQYKEPVSLVPSLLAVSAQVYFEAQDVLYGNEFVFADTSALYSFLINLGPSGAKRLKTLRLLGWSYGRASKAYNNACFAVLVWATNITAFHVDAFHGWFRSIQTGADRIYRDAFPWLEAMGREAGKADAAVDVLRINARILRTWQCNGTSQLVTDEQRYAEFKAMLSKLLAGHQKRVMAKPSKKRKVSKDVEANEE